MGVQRLVGAIVLSCVLLAQVSVCQAADEDEEYYELMKVFVDTYEQIERNYVKDLDRRELMEAAVKGMMEKLDPYSNYISPDDLARFNTSIEQEFGGIGIQVSVDPATRRLTVMTPLPGTPAYRAGIRAGDQIMEIEGKSTEGFSLEDAVKLLKGKAGESVSIGILHGGEDKVEKLTITREIIQLATVMGDTYNSDDTWNFMLDPAQKIGYIRLSAFSRNTTRELEDALALLKSQGMKSLILDLRFNPGGLLSAATEISDLFLEEGKIVSTKGRNTEERVWTAKKPGTYSGFPMAVLVNHYSASASEIVSACLQDWKRAAIIGERTWGKGSVQNVISLEGGKSALKLTTASYHRPSGKNIHRFPDSAETDEWGVMPDDEFKVPFTNEQVQKYLEYRRDRDVLSKDGPPESEFKDIQLAKAVEYVTSQMEKSTEATAEKAKPAEEKTAEESSESKPADEKPDASKESDEQSAAPRIPFLLRIPHRLAA